MLSYTLYGLFILTCIVLVVTVLLQPGKADAGALFSSSVSTTAFGPRGTATILAKITVGSAAAYMLIALTLGLPIVTGAKSVLQSSDEPAPVASPSPAAPSSLPNASPAASVETVTPAASPAASVSSSPSAKDSSKTKPSPSPKK